ncbi:hypothetical protein EON80_18030, partial [bacterium]
MKQLSIYCAAMSLSAAFSSFVCAQTPTPVAVLGSSKAASVANLRCEYLSNPMGIDAPKPRLSWNIQGGRRGWMQTAYRLQVASTAELLKAGKPDLWDSGQVASSQTLNVRYAGKTLSSGTRCFWRVQVWGNNEAKPSTFSPTQFWEMGLLSPSDWQAQWITIPVQRRADVTGVELPSSPFLRKTFTLDKPIKQATLFATARGIYEMRLNGSKVGDELMAPGWTDYRLRTQYQAYDVTRHLKRGANAVGAIIGDGWYAGYVGMGRERNHYGDLPAIRAQLDVEYSDGTHQIVSSDASWQGSTGPIVYSDMLMGELYDARKAQPNWDTTRFTPVGWKNATVAPEFTNSSTVDVTSQVATAVKNNRLSILSGNDLAGDPAFNTVKNLRVEYTLNGVKGTRTAAEKETL